MADCPAFDPLGPYVSNVVGFVDCHSLALGEAGYRALGPDTAFGEALAGALTIYVALVGYRLLLGGSFRLRSGVGVVLRLGFVLALATQWSAYQPLVYDVVTAGPADLAARVLAPGGLGGDAPGQLIDRVQAVHAALDELVHPPTPLAPPLQAAPDGVVAAPAVASPANTGDLPIEARASVASADRLLVAAVLAGMLSVRVVLALLLALGPLFIATFLFSGTRGLFVGWVRVLVGAAFAAVAVPMVIALELAVIEPQVQALASEIAASQPLGALPGELLASASLFALVMLAALIALARTAAAFRLPSGIGREIERFASSVGTPAWAAIPRAQGAGPGAAIVAEQPGQRSRAEQVADAARAMERREIQWQAGGIAADREARPRDSSPQRQHAEPPPLPLGQAGRRSGARLSAAAGRRDGA